MTADRTSRPIAGLIIAALGGLCLAVQARMNGQLGAEMHDGVAAAAFSFTSGLVVLIVLVAALPSARRGVRTLLAAVRGTGIAWWQCLGGVGGAWLVTTQGLTAGILGVAVFTVAAVAGQILSSLVVDRVGLGPTGPQALTWWRVAGAVLAVVSVVVAVSADLGTPSAITLAVLPAVAGMGVAVQQALNGQVRVVAGNAWVATLCNFTVGTGSLAVAVLIETAVRGWPHSLATEWWAYCGGLVGILLILAATVSVRLVGVLLVGLATVAGQLLGALGVDVVLPAPGQHLTVTSVAGTGMILVAVLVAAAPQLRTSR